MFGILGTIAAAWKLFLGLASYLGAGAAAAFAGYIVGRWFSPVLGLIAGAAIVGSMAVFWWAADNSKDKAYIRQLEAKQAELRLTNEALRDYSRVQAEAQLHNEAQMRALQDAIDKLEHNPACDIPKEIIDELNSIQ